MKAGGEKREAKMKRQESHWTWGGLSPWGKDERKMYCRQKKGYMLSLGTFASAFNVREVTEVIGIEERNEPSTRKEGS